MGQPTVQSDLLRRLRIAKLKGKLAAIPDRRRPLVALRDLRRPLAGKTGHSRILRAAASIERHAAHKKPGGADPGAGEGPQQPGMRIESVAIMLAVAGFRHLVQIAPNLFSVQREHDYAALEAAANGSVLARHDGTAQECRTSTLIAAPRTGDMCGPRCLERQEKNVCAT